MERILVDGYEFIKVDLNGATAVFSTGKQGLDFNKNTEEGLRNIENIKKWFQLTEVGYMSQIHSNSVITYNGEIKEGDALVTNEESTAVGVFTADCVPILIYDKRNKAIAAIHSGWRGTFSCIALKTVEIMEKQYDTKAEDLVVYIGPHMHQCCYEVSEEIIDEFRNQDIYKDLDLSEGRMLSMLKCIIYQLRIKGVREENIKDLNICTFCNKEYELHSYRKSTNKYGRMFSFIFLK
ncbi:peptidoglycan editing factor PgeF [Clostridium sp. CX1]|uniref:peptidoglycan editing factor PgeF n=1 Tax=Clostridium sp. CX1 TaxID=2978346 RepID=UPI0021C23CF0|nr:peptidoglycan editing factor PgeF [Clostridium sp. CX1]MCT8976902.1 peptidoglycan editing factor PgeF [Clostridium sp. CX1]